MAIDQNKNNKENKIKKTADKNKNKKSIEREYQDKQNSAGFSDNNQDGGDYFFTCNRQCINKKKE